MIADEEKIIPFIGVFLDTIPRVYQENTLKLFAKHKRIAVRWPRQAGKSTCTGWYCLFRAINKKNTSIMVVAPSLRQSSTFFSRMLEIVDQSKKIEPFIKNKTKTEISFANGSKIKCIPCGDGTTIKGETCDVLVIEEAGYMREEIVTRTLMPFIASKGDEGQIIKIGTPFAKNHFYDSCVSERYKSIHLTWRDVVICGGYTQSFIDEMRESMGDLEFKTEYEAEFIDGANKYFDPEVITNAINDHFMINPSEVYV